MSFSDQKVRPGEITSARTYHSTIIFGQNKCTERWLGAFILGRERHLVADSDARTLMKILPARDLSDIYHKKYHYYIEPCLRKSTFILNKVSVCGAGTPALCVPVRTASEPLSL